MYDEYDAMSRLKNRVTGQRGKYYAYLREHVLQMLFSLSLVWAVYPLLLMPVDLIVSLIPLHEGHVLHIWAEHLSFVMAVMIVSIALIVLIIYLAPDFLHVTSEMRVFLPLVSLIVSVPFVYAALLAFFVVVGIVMEPPPWSSDNPQYIPVVFYTAGIGPYLMTPSASIIAGGAWSKRYEKRRCSM